MKAVIFDLEGVIIDTETLWDEDARIFLEKRGLRYQREELKHEMSGRSLIETSAFLKERFRLEGAPEELAEERKKTFLELAKRDIDFIEGFISYFERIKTDYKVAIATAMDKTLFAAVDKKLKLTELFKGKVYHISDVGGRSKPDPAVFLLAAKNLNTSPEDCTVIEDSPLGIEGARRAGMRCIAITTTYDKELLMAADRIIDGYDEITR